MNRFKDIQSVIKDNYNSIQVFKVVNKPLYNTYSNVLRSLKVQ